MSTARLQRARWRARRGMRELDVLLNRFIDSCYADLSATGQDNFDNLLEQSDVDLYAWLTGRQSAPVGFLSDLVAQIRACKD